MYEVRRRLDLVAQIIVLCETLRKDSASKKPLIIN